VECQTERRERHKQEGTHGINKESKKEMTREEKKIERMEVRNKRLTERMRSKKEGKRIK
jgi:hypothetical protein